MFDGLRLQNGDQLLTGQVLALHQVADVLVGGFEVGCGEGVFLLGLAGETGLVFDRVDGGVELGEDVLFGCVFGGGRGVSKGSLKLLQPYFASALGVHELEEGKELVLTDIACQLIDVVQVQVAFALDVHYLQQGLEFSRAQLVLV
jgi:hypothetical protein